jgi:hypothetical protein
VKPLVLVAVALAFAAAGCGGSSAPSAEQTWAASVCTTIATWKTDVETITENAANAITKPAATRKDVEAAIDDGVAATNTLVDELRAATPPDTPEGQQARASVDAFIAYAQTSIAKVRRTLDALPDSASLVQVIAKLSGLATDLESMLRSGVNLIGTLSALGADLKAGFENAESCKALRAAS